MFFAYLVMQAIHAQSIPLLIFAVIASTAIVICWAGLFMVHPNEAKVLQLFGKYTGTAHDPGLKWANPFYTKATVSTRIRNFESNKLKVNDANGSPIEIAEALVREIQDWLTTAGVTVIEARITHLAYAPEIANAMLRRQQAAAIIAARKLIVKGAVSMVDMALTELQENKIVQLDEERKAAMVSNLLVVLCSDESAQPVLNTGSLYT